MGRKEEWRKEGSSGGRSKATDDRTGGVIAQESLMRNEGIAGTNYATLS